MEGERHHSGEQHLIDENLGNPIRTNINIKDLELD